jgi:hypothetical protein
VTVAGCEVVIDGRVLAVRELLLNGTCGISLSRRVTNPRHIIWRNWNPLDRALPGLVNCANVA